MYVSQPLNADLIFVPLQGNHRASTNNPGTYGMPEDKTGTVNENIN